MSTLFPLTPNDGSPVVETFDDLTAINTARWTGKEARRRCRAFPQYALEGSFIMWDDEDAALAPLVAGNKALVPAWMHPVILTPAPRLDALYNADALSTVRLLCFVDSGTVVIERECDQSGLLTEPLPAGTAKAYPLVEARLSEDSFTVEQVTANTRTTGLSFLSTNTDEGDAYTGATFQGLPLFPVPTDGTADMRQGSESLKVEQALVFDRWSAGHVEVQSFLYAKGVASGKFIALTRADVLALRAFLRACRGRFQAFWWPHPKTGALTKWRLAADSRSLSYLTTTTAEASLRFVEIDE